MSNHMLWGSLNILINSLHFTPKVHEPVLNANLGNNNISRWLQQWRSGKVTAGKLKQTHTNPYSPLLLHGFWLRPFSPKPASINIFIVVSWLPVTSSTDSLSHNQLCFQWHLRSLIQKEKTWARDNLKFMSSRPRSILPVSCIKLKNQKKKKTLLKKC